jgi:hypothetical protein
MNAITTASAPVEVDPACVHEKAKEADARSGRFLALLLDTPRLPELRKIGQDT